MHLLGTPSAVSRNRPGPKCLIQCAVVLRHTQVALRVHDVGLGHASTRGDSVHQHQRHGASHESGNDGDAYDLRGLHPRTPSLYDGIGRERAPERLGVGARLTRCDTDGGRPRSGLLAATTVVANVPVMVSTDILTPDSSYFQH